MREKNISEFIDFLQKLSENQILYLFTLAKKLFGSH